MTSEIEDVRALPGETVHDHRGEQVGRVTHLYAIGDDDAVIWVTVQASSETGPGRQLFVPLARLKREYDELAVPYSAEHLHGSPEIDPAGELSEDDDRALRAYYAIGYGDQELRTDNDSYASRVPAADGRPRRLDNR